MPSPAQDNPKPAEPRRSGRPRRSGPGPGKPKADKATVALRVEDLLRVRLAGAALWEMCAYVRAEERNPQSVPWFVTEERPAVSESQIRRYVQRTDDLIAATLERDRQKLLDLHLAQRRSLLARCLARDDFANARGILKDEAELLGLYPAKKTELTGKDGGPLAATVATVELTDAERAAAVATLLARAATPAAVGTADPRPDPDGPSDAP